MRPDPRDFNLDERIRWIDHIKQPDIEDYDFEDGAFPDDFIHGEATVAWFEYNSFPGSVGYLEMRRQDGRTLLRYRNDDESYPGVWGDDSFDAGPAIGDEITARELILLMDSFAGQFGPWSTLGYVQGELKGDDNRMTREEREAHLGFFINFDTMSDTVTDWYKAVTAHWAETGELAYLQPEGAEEPVRMVRNEVVFEMDTAPETYGEEEPLAVVEVREGPFGQESTIARVIAERIDGAYLYTVASPDTRYDRKVLPAPSKTTPLTMGEIIAALDAFDAPGGLVFRDRTRSNLGIHDHIAVSSAEWPLLERWYREQAGKRLGRIINSSIRTLNAGNYDLDHAPSAYPSGTPILTVALREVEGRRYDLFADTRDGGGYAFRWEATDVPRWPALPELTPGIATSDAPLTLLEMVRLLDDTIIHLPDGTTKRGLVLHWPSVNHEIEEARRQRHAELVEITSEVYPDLRDLTIARAYDWKMHGTLPSAADLRESAPPYDPDAQAGRHRSLMGIFGDMEME